MRTCAVFLFVALSASGCLNFGEVDDAKVPGDLLGTYAVAGTLTDSSCGEGALGSSDNWNFDVKLSRFHEDIYWINGREVISGGIAPDGVTFSFSTRVEGEVMPACVLSRSDSARGTLSSESLDVETFEATLTFDFSSVDESDCSTWVGSPEGVETLPCSISYDLAGSRTTAAPEPDRE